MEGITSFPMRLWLQLTSQPEAMTSPFLRVTRAFPEQQLPSSFIPELMQLRGVLPYQLTPQFITGDPQQLLRVAELVPTAISPTIELNCGCPSPNSLGKLAGSGMLSDPELLARTLEELTRELGPQRLAIKMRIGLEDDAEFPALLKAVASLPLARLTIHARTRADGYRGQARWTAIQAAAAASSTPVHASGDLLGIESWQRLQQIAPDIQGAMIGRGLLRNPWVFSELRDGLKTRLTPITLIQALFCFLLLHELALQHPEKLIHRVGNGRLGSGCGTDFNAWEKATVELTSLVFGVPFLLLHSSSLQYRKVSSVAFSRLRLLWTYLQSGLPAAFANSSVIRARKAEDFFEQLFKVAEDQPDSDLEISHQAAWDTQFAGARG